MRSLFHSALHYLFHPTSYRLALRAARSRFFGTPFSLELSRAPMQRWCQSRALQVSAALERLGVEAHDRVEERFAPVFELARSRVNRCPVLMGGAANLDLLYALCQKSQARCVVETGVAHGWSSLAILLHLRQMGNGHLYSTNMPYVEYAGKDLEYVGCAVPPELALNWHLFSGADQEHLPAILKTCGPVDLCHYDSDKSYAGRMWAYPRLWDSLRIGGVFMSDDIGDNLAFAHFCACLRDRPIVVTVPDRDNKCKYIGIVVKARPERRSIVF